VVVHLGSGYDVAPLTYPRIITDVTGDHTISALDASTLSAKVVHLPVPGIPNPGPATLTLGGAVVAPPWDTPLQSAGTFADTSANVQTLSFAPTTQPAGPTNVAPLADQCSPESTAQTASQSAGRPIVASGMTLSAPSPTNFGPKMRATIAARHPSKTRVQRMVAALNKLNLNFFGQR